jgi:hypothetical protein
MTIRILILLPLVLFLNSCVEEFRPDLDEINQFLVVDGGISNIEGPYTIKLSISSGLDIISPEPISGAIVSIVEEDGMEEILTEVEPGTYMTKEGGIQGIIGHSYKLMLEIEGKKYESEYEVIREPTAIKSIDAELEYRSFPDATEEVPGIQFYVNSEVSKDPETYFLWLQEGTYKYKSSLLIYYEFNGFISEFNNHDSLQTCYLTYRIHEIQTANTNNLEVPEIKAKPLHFLPANDRKLKIRYSLLTSQLSVSKAAYEFWYGLERQTKNNTSLHTSQPYQIRGNVKNMNDSTEAVLGYFLVSGQSQKRIFLDRPNEVEIYIEDCALDYMGYAYIFWTRQPEWPIYITQGASGARAIAAKGCMDCRRTGGVLEAPSFWVE